MPLRLRAKVPVQNRGLFFGHLILDNAMLVAVLAGFIAALFAPHLQKHFPNYAGWIVSVVAAGIFAYLCSFISPVIAGNALSIEYRWIPQLGVNAHFYIDGLSLFFALLVSSFGALILLYTSRYLHDHPYLGRFYLYLLAFMASMLGLVLSGNLISLFVFWELTSITSFLLIGFNNEEEVSRKSALQAFLVTASGGMALLAGFILLHTAGGSYEFTHLLSQGELLREHSLFVPFTLLILLGACTKSAQFPFHFWLPNAMAAPTPVSAYLHSATMVKAGVYLIARFNPILGNTPIWQYTLMVLGGFTMVMGAFVAILHTDLKKILAYTTVSALGMLFLMIGIDTVPAIQAAVVFILAHALYKGTLFLITGNVDHGTGSRDVLVLSGLRKYMPITAGSAVLACMAMSGFIPFFGFIAKEMLYAAALEAPAFASVLIGVVILSGVLFVTVAIIIGYGVFFGPYREAPHPPHEASKEMLVAPVMLSLLGLVFGIFPEIFPQRLLNATTTAVLNQPTQLELHIWHGFNTILILSLLTLLAGYLLYRFLPRLPQLRKLVSTLAKLSPENGYRLGLSGVDRLAVEQTVFFQNGYLRNYISTILLTFIGLVIYTMYNYQLPLRFFSRIFSVTDVYLHEAITCLLFPIALLILFPTHSRLTALTVLGVVGYAVALIFLYFGAPDVTITQFLVETLTVVLFVLVLHRLPLFWSVASNRTRIKYALLAITFGAVMTYVLLSVTDLPPVTGLKDYFAVKSVDPGHGRNIVNVILVDFRALDTMGEITVLGIASLGIYSLMKLQLDRDKTP